MNTHAPLPASVTRADTLRETLEEMIVDGRLAAGDRLDETELAKTFVVSRTPVREAIRALIAVGLVDAGGRQGAVVARVSVPMLIEMFDLMAQQEGMCARLAARRATDLERSGMHATHALLQAAYEAGDPNDFYRVNIDFHDQLYAAAHTHFLAGQTLRLRRRLAPYRLRVTYQPGRMLASLAEHHAIICAIEDHDGERAMEAARSHVRLLGDQLEDFIAGLPDTVTR